MQTHTTGQIDQRVLGRGSVFIAAVALISLYGTVTNLLPVSIFLCVVAVAYLPIHLFAKQLPGIFRISFVFFLYCLISVLVYSPQALLEPLFYRYDGNVFVMMTLFLVIGAIKKPWDTDKILNYFMTFCVVIYTPITLIQVWLGGIPTIGLFSSFNAYGGFLMFPFAIALVGFFENRRLSYLLFVLFFGILLLATFSRGSLFGIIGATFAYLCMKKNVKWPLYLVFAAIIGTFIVILFQTYPVYLTIVDYFDFVNFYAMTGKEANILLRMYENWPRGLHGFLNSPIFGVGYGGLNDFPLEFEGLWPFTLNTGELAYNSAHAHNTFLHIAGELGIVGLIMFLLLCRSIFKYLYSSQTHMFSRNVLIFSFWALIFASFTEHRFFSPSNCLPVFIMLFIYFSRLEWDKYKQRVLGDA